jgi:hypothetical protein
MRRRLLFFAAAASLLPLAARAQGSGPLRRVAVLVLQSESDPEGQARFASLRQGLRDLGWIEGKNLHIDVRYAGGSFEQNFHVAHRLDRYAAGRRMEFATSAPDMIAEAMIAELQKPARFKPVEADGAVRAARLLAELL